MSFDHIAPFYQLLETIAFGRTLQCARICLINRIPRPTRALIVGEGNGRFLCELVGVHPKTNIDCVDASARMLQLARARLQGNHPESLARICFYHDDIRKWSPPHSYDLIVTHFFLDCFHRADIESIVAKLAVCAMENATWLVSDFALPKKLVARIHAGIWLKAMYAFFRLTAGIPAHALVDPRSYLESHGFTQTSIRLFRSGALNASLYSRS